MPTYADYTIIRDTKFELRPGQEQTFSFNVPGNIVRSGNSQRPVLFYFADPSSGAKSLHTEVELNDVVVGNYNYSGGVGRTHLEVLNHTNLNPGRNTIQFRVESGDGSMNFADVVLLYQQNV